MLRNVLLLLLLNCKFSPGGSYFTEKWGVVLVDFFPNAGISRRMQTLLVRLSVISPHLHIELWIHKSMVVEENLKHGENVKIKHLEIPDIIEANINKWGYASKAIGLIESSFSTAFFFDADIWFLHRGWETVIDSLLEQNPYVDIFWTVEDDPNDRYKTTYISPEIKRDEFEYFRFPMKNTGIVGIRKSGVVRQLLNKTIEIFHAELTQSETLHGRRLHGSQDQDSFREAAFLERGNLKQKILPDNVFCRALNVMGQPMHNPSDCSYSPTCVTIHYDDFFQSCHSKLMQSDR